ncbi:MAG: phage capsid protein [Alphaproteobacteria bacterium]
MTQNLELSFVRAFEAEVHSAYQRMGSKLRGTVRTRNNVKGSTTTFQVVGKGSAGTKARNGQVPVMNINHTPVEIALSDYYAGDWLDKLDELKLNHDEKTVVANAGAYALGRKTDELIINALDANASIATTTKSATDLRKTDGLTKAKVLSAFEKLGEADVPDDGDRIAVVGWKQWSDLMALPEFASSDYIGKDELPWKGTQAKRWLGTLWIPHSGLTIKSGARQCYWYHKNAIAHASGSNVKTDVSWHGDRAAFFINNMMSQGAGVVDASGIVKFECAE